MRVYKCSMSPFKTPVLTDEITVFVTSNSYSTGVRDLWQ